MEEILKDAMQTAQRYFDAALNATRGADLAGLQDRLVNVPLLPVVVTIILGMVCGFLMSRNGSKGPRFAQTEETADAEALMRSLGCDCDHPIEEGTMIPSMGAFQGNSEEMATFSNDWAEGRFLSMHRATYDKQLDKSGEYRYGEYFLGKKRLWEARMQFSFKQKPPRPQDCFFGVETEEFVPMNATSKNMMGILVETLKGAVGKQIYHTVGDDPSKVSGPLERPQFVMPLYAYDQYIVTPPGETPPDLRDPNMPNLGSCRSGRVRQYKEEIEKLEFKQGYTYTFNFWGISQWLDRLNWQAVMPLVRTRVDFNQLCGRPPVHVVIYFLKPDKINKEDKRHLHFQKNYIFDCVFWSSICRPPKEVLNEVFKGIPRKAKTMENGHSKENGSRSKGKKESSQGFWTCCVARP